MRAPAQWTAFTVSGFLYLLAFYLLRLVVHGSYELPALTDVKDLLPYLAVVVVVTSFVVGQLLDATVRVLFHRPVGFLAQKWGIELRFTPHAVGPNRDIVRALSLATAGPVADMFNEHLRDIVMYRSLAPAAFAAGFASAVWLWFSKHPSGPWPTILFTAAISTLSLVVYYDRVKHLRMLTRFLTKDPAFGGGERPVEGTPAALPQSSQLGSPVRSNPPSRA